MRIKDMEDNENSFVALWSNKLQLDCAVLYSNSEMNDDQFFNRVTDINCREYGVVIERIEREFAKRRVKPFVYCQGNNILSEELKRRNYVLHDSMHVLQFSGANLKIPDNIRIDRVDNTNMGYWVSVFCMAFQSENWYTEIRRIVTETLDRIQFYVAYFDAKPAGCSAYYVKNALLGLYSLGTLSNYRDKGIATALIAKAANIASEKKITLYLQTFRADGFLGIYKKLGFTQVYTKEVWSKEKG